MTVFLLKAIGYQQLIVLSYLLDYPDTRMFLLKADS